MGPAPRWEGARNLIDLGGLRTSDGGSTVRGRVWRSAAPEWMTSTGWRQARADGLTRVIDLRNADEQGRGTHHPLVAVEATRGIERIHAPVEGPGADPSDDQDGWPDDPSSWERTVQRHAPRYVRVLEALVESPGPVLLHCAGGRDRAGLVSALLLMLADVTPESLAEHFEEGFRGAAEHPIASVAYHPSSGAWKPDETGPFTPRELDEVLSVRLPALREWAATTRFEDTLREAGLGELTLARLRRLLRPERNSRLG